LAILLNPVHAHITNPRLWKAEADGRMRVQHHTKWAFSRLRLVEEIAIPPMNSVEKLSFAVRCKRAVCPGCECEPARYVAAAARAKDGGPLDYFVAQAAQAAANWKAIALVDLANEVWDAHDLECARAG
jgi:hypothetical protein